MKKIILLVVLVVVISIPCFAQEVETDGIFSIGGTAWKCRGLKVTWAQPFIELYDETVYFTDKSVETTSGNIGILRDVDTYLDFLIFSVAWGEISRWGDPWMYQYTMEGIMILQPAIGLGTFSSLIWKPTPTAIRLITGVVFGYMIKCPPDGCDNSSFQ
jgi:hypothetical protein